MPLALFLALDASAAEISETKLEALPDADIYIVGETHDNPLHHHRQALIVKTLQPSAIVFEMLSPDQALRAKGVDRSDIEQLSMALKWSDRGWGNFVSRHATFTAAPDTTIYGTAVPRAGLGRAVDEGAAAAFGDQAALFGLDAALPSSQQAQRELLQDEAHCGALPAEMIPGMVEVQRLRDASFSQAALRALEDTGGPVVVITGNGHARDWGMPYALGRAAPDVEVVSIGQVTPEEIDPPFDLWFASAQLQRADDPCDAFKSK